MGVPKHYSTFSFGLDVSASSEDCRSVRIKAHEVKKIVASLLFRRNCAI